MKAMVLAAGEGTRLRPLTLATPKPMLDVAGCPVLEWIFLWLRRHGIRQIVVNLSHLPDVVRSYFGDGGNWGIEIAYSIESAIMGTAGGIKRVEYLFDGPFIVVYGDVLTDMDLGRLWRFHESCDSRPHVTLSLSRAKKPWECGVVTVGADHRVTRFEEKPPRDRVFSDLTNAGVLVMDREVLRYIPEQQFYDVSADLLPELLRRQIPIYAQPAEKCLYLLDIGTMESYQRAQREWPKVAISQTIEAGVQVA